MTPPHFKIVVISKLNLLAVVQFRKTPQIRVNQNPNKQQKLNAIFCPLGWKIMVFGRRKWLDKKPNKLNLINLSVVVAFGVSWWC
jgi:hypothetical protein